MSVGVLGELVGRLISKLLLFIKHMFGETCGEGPMVIIGD